MEQIRKSREWALQYRAGDVLRDAEIKALAKDAEVSDVMATLLYTRGYRTIEQVMAFLNQEAACLHDPFSMLDMDRAVARIEKALSSDEKIAIYGDYDVDGVTSVSFLYLYLTSRGADVGYYIPGRMQEGYGVSVAAVDRLAERGVKLMITVDTGITAIEETAYAKKCGIDTVVTDHHECREELPDVDAVVNPHRVGDPYPFKELAGVGVVFKLICALEMSRCRQAGIPEQSGVGQICRTYADLVAIGTIADVMPVVDENRLIVTLGLRLLNRTERPGLAALIEAASGGKSDGSKYPPKKRKINSTFIGFTIAPRMNAAGRVSNASIAVELLLSEDRETAERLADELCQLNLMRQKEENRIVEEAYEKIEKTLDNENNRVIVIDDDTWQQGIIGIVSSRITERYGLPSILISFDGAIGGVPLGTDIGKGSGRSIKGLNLVEALIDSEDLLVRFGGHELAAGLSIQRSNIDAFRRNINRYAAEHLTEEQMRISLDAHCEVNIRDLTMTLAHELDMLEPYGVANPVPNFILRNARVMRIIPMGGGRHLRLILESDGIEMTAVWFGVGEAAFGFSLYEYVDVLFQLNVNEFQNVTSLQMIVQDMHHAEEHEVVYQQNIARYEEIRAGATYDAGECVLPDREDIAAVYTALRREYRAGHTMFTMRRILTLLESVGVSEINYIKLKFIIRIMQELQICEVTEPDTDHYMFEFGYRAEKTNIERSSILHKLKTQQRRA